MNITLTQIGGLALVILLGLSIYLFKANKDLKRNISDRDITIESMAVGLQEYKAKDGSWNQRLINERQSSKKIANSKDSIIIRMNEQLKNAGIKLQNALALGYEETTITVDTIVKYRPIKRKDTTLNFSKLPHIVNTVKLTDTTATNRLIVADSLYYITHANREFVNRRRSFFLWRWFKERHWVITTDIHHANPYIKTNNAKFITIVENNGKTKTIEK